MRRNFHKINEALIKFGILENNHPPLEYFYSYPCLYWAQRDYAIFRSLEIRPKKLERFKLNIQKILTNTCPKFYITSISYNKWLDNPKLANFNKSLSTQLSEDATNCVIEEYSNFISSQYWGSDNFWGGIIKCKVYGIQNFSLIDQKKKFSSFVKGECTSNGALWLYRQLQESYQEICNSIFNIKSFINADLIFKVALKNAKENLLAILKEEKIKVADQLNAFLDSLFDFLFVTKGFKAIITRYAFLDVRTTETNDNNELFNNQFSSFIINIVNHVKNIYRPLNSISRSTYYNKSFKFQ